MSSDIALINKRISELVFANPCLTLPELAISLGIDRRKIEEALKKQYGHGFRALKNKVRLDYIIKLLVKDNPRNSIKEIATAVDMHPNNLSRFIRMMTGCCARELRNDNMPFHISSSHNQMIFKNVQIETLTKMIDNSC